MTYTVRRTPSETLAVAEPSADAAFSRDRALGLFEDTPEMRTLLRAFAAILLDQLNVLRGKHAMPALTMADVRAALVAEIRSGRWD